MKNDFESKQSIHGKEDGKFLEEIRSELGLSSSQKVLKVTEKVLRSIQKNLGGEEIKNLLVKLPKSLQTFFSSNLSQQETPIYFDHLDQWVETIYREDELSRDRAFYSEIEILNVIILMMRKLDKLYDLLSFPAFKFSLIREIKQASI
jgi:uncharacterized protein (DUF2267 family)